MKLKLFLTSLIFAMLFCLVPNKSFSEDYHHPSYDFLIASTDDKKINLYVVKKNGEKELRSELRRHTSKVTHVKWVIGKPEIISKSKNEIIRWRYYTGGGVEVIKFRKRWN